MRRCSAVVIDDDSKVRETLLDCLDEFEFDVVGSAVDGVAGLDLLRATTPDVALVDLRMPGINGIELVRAARAEGLPTAIVLLSAYDDRALVEAGIEAGAFDYVVKGARLQFIAGVLMRARRCPPPHQF